MYKCNFTTEIFYDGATCNKGVKNFPNVPFMSAHSHFWHNKIMRIATAGHALNAPHDRTSFKTGTKSQSTVAEIHSQLCWMFYDKFTTLQNNKNLLKRSP
jgi:hypothetical protein